MRVKIIVVVSVLLILSPLLFAQDHIKQQVINPDGSQVNTTMVTGFLDTFPWEKLAAFLGCASLLPVIIVKWIIKPALREENDRQMKLMETKFPSKEAFVAHELADKTFQDDMKLFLWHHPTKPPIELKDKY